MNIYRAVFMHRSFLNEIFSLMVAVMFLVSIIFAFGRRNLGSGPANGAAA